MIAALPMYDRPENAAAHDTFWQLVRDGLRARGIEAPDALDRETPYDETWARPDLVLGQICNLPWRAGFRDRVTLVGASDYGLPGAGPGEYYSLIVARADDAAPGLRFALNDPLSNSGWDAGQTWARRNGVAIDPTLVTGSHAESLRAVAEGHADLAAIDAITWRMLQRWHPLAGRVRVLDRTAASPGQSFITRAGQDPAPYREAIAEAIATLPRPESDLLGLRRIVVLPLSAYDLPLPPVPNVTAR
ncbi:ABC-type phosphate/phosphonate transport system, periplasmic component [Rubellimicrobium mesophilum DSM 19309]|uniref:ABC-type phosphate/phosphonate transport system, periplasmic component n=1 Tax=Rubellimicrobium mesophilum DSM 19309 TaxID=442562 RepID=A0A017HV16_9RHOB|nr:PhnD/SsuA/transferrin family substrate-binding protein [Rubellimicrobium mesophilum]EYD78352.1 ABC-type phosphate/phosphonate transport system, periplasmic component [Rubellimicrobium mesophilum DSM 19309]